MMYQYLTRKTPLALLLVTALALPAPLCAQSTAGNPSIVDAATLAQLIEDKSGAERINISGRLRMLSQRMSSATCWLTAGGDAATYTKVTTDSVAEYDAILAALESGDEAMNIKGVEESRKVLAAIGAVKQEWAGFRSAVTGVTDGSAVEDGLAYVAAHNLDLLAKAQALVTEVSTLYANPAEMLLADALVIEIAGRQRMLTQRMAKESCAVVTGNAALGTAEGLGKTMKLYVASITALREGNETVGIKPPPTDDIKAALDAVWEGFQKVLPRLEAVQTGTLTGVNEESLSIPTDLQKLVGMMNDAMKLYTGAAKQNL
jgi:Type IV pili methyl-accepting chemotaxis transducer N-term